MNRRQFTAIAGLSSAGFALANNAVAAGSSHKFHKSLSWGAVGVSANQQQAIDYAAKYGFGSVSAAVTDLEKMSADERKALVDGMKAKGLQWGSSGLPVDFRKDEETFKDGVKQLPARAKVLKEVGVTRVSTWIMSNHSELTYIQNFNQHRDRLREAAKILNGEGLRFGLEYVGPKTTWAANRYPFIHSQLEMQDLVAAIDVKGVGILLDSWHWFTSHGTMEELMLMTNDDIIDCQVNDAPTGLEIDEQKDLSRELPCATGVIDLKAFMEYLVKIGYDGPISCEPFNKPLNDMDNDEALKATIDSLDKLFALV